MRGGENGGAGGETGEGVGAVVVAHHGELVELCEGCNAIDVVRNRTVQAPDQLPGPRFALFHLCRPLILGDIPAGPANVGGARELHGDVGGLDALLIGLPYCRLDALRVGLVLVYVVVPDAALVKVKAAVFLRSAKQIAKRVGMMGGARSEATS